MRLFSLAECINKILIMKRTVRCSSLSSLTLTMGLLWLTGCASLQDLAQLKKPGAEITGLRLDKLDLQQLGMVVELKVSNPNAVGLNLSRLEYDFLVEGNSLFKGTQDQGVRMAANSTQQIEIPVSINPANLWQTIRQVAKQDRFNLALSSVASFAVPALGEVRLPLKKTIELPVLHTPAVKVAGLRQKALNLSRAELELALEVQNPNAFSLLLNQFTYDFKVRDHSWAKGLNTQPQRVDSKRANEIRIPITLNFLEMGLTVYQTLTSRAPLDYRLDGQFNFGSSESYLKSLAVPVNYVGTVNIIK